MKVSKTLWRMALGLSVLSGCSQDRIASLESAIASNDQESITSLSLECRKYLERHEKVLSEALQSENENARIGALRALRVMPTGSPHLLSAIAGCLQDPSPQIRLESAETLLDSTVTPTVISALREALHDGNGDVRNCAATALFRNADFDYLFAQLDSEDANARLASIYGLSGGGSGQEMDAIRQGSFIRKMAVLGITDLHPSVRHEARSALRHSRSGLDPDVLDYLHSAYLEVDNQDRAAVLETMFAVAPKHPDTLNFLRRSSKDESDEVSKTALRLLMSIEDNSE